MKKGYYLIAVLLVSVQVSFAQQGKNGSKTITANTTVNEYTVLTANASTGNTSITVSNNTLNTKGRFSSSLSAGDLIMIIQMQGATINGSAADSTWGAVTGYNNCGLYEFNQVTGISGTTQINLQCPLQNNYTVTGQVQVVRVPRFSSLTINANDTLTCDNWNGITGGVIAVEIQNNTTVNGTINATGAGFRGGQVQNSASNTGTFNFVSNDPDLGAQKGESIAGYQTGYNVFGGMYCRGAPANGGGGGDSHNSAGGGGANAGDITGWTGNGNPDITTSANYASAWNLEYNGFATSTSSGGGRGGYTWCTNYNNPYTTAPGNGAWGGDLRRNVGGDGGRALDYTTGRLFFGGGGGAAQEDNSFGGDGGNGGGIIYILSYGTISGSGSVISNGIKGQDAVCPAGQGDPPGGGGGGGAIILNSAGAVSGITISANGGAGGNQNITTNGVQPDESEGAGGGGGGGYIALSNSGLTTQVLGGVNGTSNSIGVTPFLPNGGTAGGKGIDTLIPVCVPQLSAINGPVSVCPNTIVTYSVAPACGSPTYTWTLPAGWSGASTTNSITATSGTAGGTISVTLNPAASCPPLPSQDTSVAVTVAPLPVAPHLAKDTVICGAIHLTLNAGSTGFRYYWSTGDTIPVINVTDTGTYKIQVFNTCDTVKDSITVIQLFLPKVSLGNDTTLCNFTNVVLKANTDTTVSSYLWSTGATTPFIIVPTAGTYRVTVANSCGSATDSVVISGCIGGYVVPNAFTPGVGENGLFGLIKTGDGIVTLMSFRIYNRWGQLIFSTNDDQQKWDGRFNGLPEPIDVYVYVVQYIDSFKATKLLKGNITLLR